MITINVMLLIRPSAPIPVALVASAVGSAASAYVVAVPAVTVPVAEDVKRTVVDAHFCTVFGGKSKQ